MKNEDITVTTHNINNNSNNEINNDIENIENNNDFIIVQDCFINGVMFTKGEILTKQQIDTDIQKYINSGFIAKLTAKNKI